jgi:hypothetical protein
VVRSSAPPHRTLKRRASASARLARAFARVACVNADAADALLRYCEAEASALLLSNRDLVAALVDAILQIWTLTGREVDQTIARAIAARSLSIERARRIDWQEREKSAALLAL